MARKQNGRKNAARKARTEAAQSKIQANSEPIFAPEPRRLSESEIDLSYRVPNFMIFEDTYDVDPHSLEVRAGFAAEMKMLTGSHYPPVKVAQEAHYLFWEELTRRFEERLPAIAAEL
jgi:hypothetical protein